MSTPSLTLIQLISEQTIPNLLPILRLRPAKVVHLFTPRTASRAAAVVRAARAAGIDPQFENVELTQMPGIGETYRAVAQTIEAAAPPCVVNFTGGTKLMSIGAYAAARTHNTPSLYVDTLDSCFVDGGTNPEMMSLLDNDPGLSALRKVLRVDILAIANGIARVTQSKDPAPVRPLARHLFENPGEEQQVWEAIQGPGGLFPGGKEPRTPAGWLEFLDRPIPFPPRTARLAIEAGILRPGPQDSGALLPDSSRQELLELSSTRVENYPARYFHAVAPLQHAVSLLSGGWWELIVFDAAEATGLFRDLRWSARVGQRNGPEVEEDILGVCGVELLYISCKRMGARARLLPLLEEIRSRAATTGGSFTRRFLAVRYPLHSRPAANLQSQARRLGIRLLTPSNLEDPAAWTSAP